MTKSRTLRRAGAVVLSLAMAATTVFAGGVDSKAASKVKLSSTKKTFAAKGGTATVKIKGATSAKISSTTVKSSKTSVATVKKSSKVKFKVTAKKNTTTKKKAATITAKVKIAKKYQKKYTKKSYTLKYKVTVKAAAVTPTEVPVKVDVKLEANDTPQADGSFLAGCTMKLSYGSALGTPYSVTWYNSDKVVNIYTTDGGNMDNALDMGGATAAAGTWYVEVKNTAGKVYTSNKVTVVADEVGAVIEDFSIKNDTATENGTGLAFAKADTKAVISVTLNRDYDGTFYVFKSDDDKPTKATAKSSRVAWDETKKTVVDTPAADGWTVITKDKNFTEAKALVATTGCIEKENADKTWTYMFKTDVGAGKGIDRGGSYYVVFDQDAENIKDDVDAGDATKNGTLNKFATPATAPYIDAPTAVTLDYPVAGINTYKATLKNAEGSAYKQINDTVANTASSLVIATEAGKSVGTADNFVSGVATVGGSAAVPGIKYTATWTGDKDVYGPEKVEVKSDLVATKIAGASSVNVNNSQAQDVKHTVNVTLAGVLTAGKVYITKDTSKFDATKSDTYESVSAAVAKDATKTEIENAVSAAGTYFAVFVPDDQEKYGNKESGVFTVSAVIASYAMAELTEVVPGEQTAAVLTAKDQFGNDTTPADQTITKAQMTAINEKDSTLIGAAANVAGTAGNTHQFAVSSGKWTITANNKPTKGETYIKKLAGNSYFVATCDSQGDAADGSNSTWTISVKDIPETKGVIVPETQVATAVVDAAGTKVTSAVGTADTESEEITLFADYYVIDQFGNFVTSNQFTEAGTVNTVDGTTNDGLTSNLSWNTDGKVNKKNGLVYSSKPGVSAKDEVEVLGCKFNVTVTINAVGLANAKAGFGNIAADVLSDNCTVADIATAVSNAAGYDAHYFTKVSLAASEANAATTITAYFVDGTTATKTFDAVNHLAFEADDDIFTA